MKTIRKYSHVITQILIWALLLVIPYGYSVAEGRDYISSLWMFWFLLPMYTTMALGFYINYFLLIPKLYLEKKYWQFFLSTGILYYLLGKLSGLISSLMFQIPDDVVVKPPLQWVWLGTMTQLLVNILLLFVAIAIRVQQQNSKIEEDARRRAEEQERRETEEQDNKTLEPTMALAQSIPASATPNYIFVKSDYKQIRIDLDDIMYVSSMKDYVRIRTISQKLPITALSTMKAIEEKLPSDRFCRIHRSHIVAIDKIESVENNRVKIADQLLPVSETYVEAFEKRIKN